MSYTAEQQKEYMRKWHAARPNYRKEAHRKDPRTELRGAARKRAIKKGVPFELTREDIVVPTHCPLLGIELKVVAVRRITSL